MLRTNTCGNLRIKDTNKEVTLCGWIHARRDHGGVIFIDLRDRYGLTQVVFNPDFKKESHAAAEHLRREDVLQARGIVKERLAGMKNPNLTTGDIEVFISHLTILNKSDVPPLEVDDRIVANEDVRMKYRYLDLRRPVMQHHILLRHKAAQATREFLSSNDFLEIETPIMVRTTPGGARVFKVPSRVHPGKFYALPESPQIYKQLLMVSGCDRYFQLARCMRDEDLRADRQPEFTQIDLEMSFVDQSDVQSIVEGLIKHLFKKILNITLKTPFQHLTFHDAMSKYGSDKPDLRFGLEFVDITDIAKHSDFGVFHSVIDKKGTVFCLLIPGAASFSRTEIEELIEIAKLYKLPGLAWMKMQNGKLESNIVKYFKEHVQKDIINVAKAKDGDLLIFAAEEFEKAATALGQVRLHLGKKLNLIKPNDWKFCWIVDFPLYEWSEDTKGWQARHHIFSYPKDEDIEKLETDPAAVRGKLYDVVLNGVEIGGGSIRIHRKDLQERVLNVIGLTYKEAEKKFDFLLEAFKYGAPPHGGIALGFDRLVTLMGGMSDIREFIAFPKTKAAETLMDSSPQQWTKEFLHELHLQLDDAARKNIGL